MHHDQTDQGRQSAGELFVACQEKPISASTCIQLAFDTAVKVVKQRSTMGRQRTGHASNDPGLESRREHRVAGAQARGLEAGFADPPTSQSGPSGQWPVAHLAHGSPYRRPHHPRPRPHASMPHASRRLPFPRDPTPHPSLTTTQSSSLLLSLHLPSALALVFFTPIHIHPPQQWPVRACFPLDLPSTARPRHCHTCVTAVCPRVEVVYAFLCGHPAPLY